MSTENVACITRSAWLKSESAGAMNFLNGIAEQFPDAISLAAGRPPDQLIQTSRIPEVLKTGIKFEALRRNESLIRTWNRFGQYSDTDGIIEYTLKKMLEQTENLDMSDVAIRVTNGIQEALLIECLWAASLNGAIVAFDPTYVGIAGAAAIAGLPLYVTPRQEYSVGAIIEAIRAAKAAVPGPVVCYMIADYDNPTSLTLSSAERNELVEIARQEDVLILEDSAYRFFNYNNERLPTLFELDKDGRVIHLVSFSKTFMPALRFGFTARRNCGPASAHCSRRTEIKSYVSVLTSPIVQASVAGYMDSISFDLSKENAPRRVLCKNNRDVLDKAMSDYCSDIEGMAWKSPDGGFFMKIDVPFTMSQQDSFVAARDFGVIVLPMQMFSPTGRMEKAIRLSFSAALPEALTEGALRFAAYATSRIR